MRGTANPWHDAAVPNDRVPAVADGRLLLPGLEVVSADSHWSIREDIFWEGFPADLKSRAPRVWVDDDGAPQIGTDRHESIVPEQARRVLACSEARAGASDVRTRMADLAAEGITTDVAFGNAVNGFLAHPDLEVREAVCEVYNQHLADAQDQAPGRFYGVGLLPYWDMARVEQSVHEIRQLGLKTALLPNNPRDGQGKPLNYADAWMDPLWQAIEESGLPVCFHVAEGGWNSPGPNAETIAFLVATGSFRQQFGSLVFGGILDRHPGLRVVFAEADINWVPGCLQHAEMQYAAWRTLLDPRPRRTPSEYWHENMYATFQHDAVGLRMLDEIGDDRVMWGSDYPHLESTLGFGWRAINDVIDSVAESSARKILGDNARAVFEIA